MENFNPSNPEYKKVDDLPEEIRKFYKNSGEGFVRKSFVEIPNLGDKEIEQERQEMESGRTVSSHDKAEAYVNSLFERESTINQYKGSLIKSLQKSLSSFKPYEEHDSYGPVSPDEFETLQRSVEHASTELNGILKMETELRKEADEAFFNKYSVNATNDNSFDVRILDDHINNHTRGVGYSGSIFANLFNGNNQITLNKDFLKKELPQSIEYNIEGTDDYVVKSLKIESEQEKKYKFSINWGSYQQGLSSSGMDYEFDTYEKALEAMYSKELPKAME